MPLPNTATANAIPRLPPAIESVPWWRVGVMWFFVGALGLVVIASFALLGTAIRHMDTVEPQAAVHVAVPNTPGSPALQARNHAATPSPAPAR